MDMTAGRGLTGYGGRGGDGTYKGVALTGGSGRLPDVLMAHFRCW